MKNQTLCIVAMLISACTAKENGMKYTDFEDLVSQATDYLKAKNESNDRLFGVGNYARYEYDLHRGEIWWSEPNGPKVRAKVTVVGSTSTRSDTWMWAWANPHFSDVSIGEIDRVREFGEKETIQKLMEGKWNADEIDGWEMTSISARLLESQGAYRSPGENGALFLLYDELEFIPEDEKESYRPIKKPEAEQSASDNGDKPRV